MRTVQCTRVQFGATELMCSDRSRFCFIDTLAVGTVSKHCRVARCERMGLSVARMGRVGNLNYGLETRGRRFLGVVRRVCKFIIEVGFHSVLRSVVPLSYCCAHCIT